MDLTNAGLAATLRAMPSVGRLLERWPLPAREAAADALRHELASLRAGLLDGTIMQPPGDEAIVQRATARLAAAARPVLRRVINATGIILHTNLAARRSRPRRCGR